jgi:hypothetical protein
MDATSLQVVKGNRVALRPSLNAAGGIAEIAITGAEPTASIDPEMLTLAEFDPWQKWEEAQGLAVKLTVGTAAGNRFRIILKRAIPDSVSSAARDGILNYDLPLVLSGDGDDEIDIWAW